MSRLRVSTGRCARHEPWPRAASSRAWFNDTWTWDGSNWTQKSPQTSPPGRTYAAMAYDSARGQAVLFGGNGSGNPYLGDTWVWDGSNWTQESLQNGPPGRRSPVTVPFSTAGHT